MTEIVDHEQHSLFLYKIMASAPLTLPNLDVIPKKVEMTEHEVSLVKWEEFALSVEEHFHALELWQRNPSGLPMGHHR